MQVINAINVNQALCLGLHALRVQGIKQPSRVGDVLVCPHPVMTVYHNPMNRVLFSPVRNANPFFHVMEALWMLAGRNDLPWLAQFNKRMASYSDDGGKTQPGAYGFRWREYFGYDQLETICDELKHNPQTRRCVLAMWDPGCHLYDHKPDGTPTTLLPRAREGDLFQAIGGSADVPCNTHAYFDTIDGCLNMTVCCRSNDVIWGAYGANAVHFSFLLEYVAIRTGIPMGKLRQFSNNFHLYTNIVPEGQIMTWARDAESSDRYTEACGVPSIRKSRLPSLRQVALMSTERESWLDDLRFFMDAPHERQFADPFFADVALHMYNSYMAFKRKDYSGAIDAADRIRAEDWRIACIEWLQRRKIKAETNKEPFTEVVEPVVITDLGVEER